MDNNEEAQKRKEWVCYWSEPEMLWWGVPLILINVSSAQRFVLCLFFFYLFSFFSQCKAPDSETYRFYLLNAFETHPSRIYAKFSSSLMYFFFRSFLGCNRMLVATLPTKSQPFSSLLLPIHHSFSVVWEYYFIWQLTSLSTLIVSLDGRQRSAFRYSSLPWVGFHAYSSSIKKKAIPLQAWTSPECARRLRLSEFKTIGTWGW